MGQVRVLHLLVKNKESRNPVSRRTNKPTTDLTVAQAHTILKGYQAKMDGLKGKKFFVLIFQ